MIYLTSFIVNNVYFNLNNIFSQLSFWIIVHMLNNKLSAVIFKFFNPFINYVNLN